MATFTHPTLGAITLNASARAKRISLRVKPSGEVILTLPRGVDQSVALSFLERKQGWVAQTLERIKTKQPDRPILPPFSTRDHSLELEPSSSDHFSVKIKVGIVAVAYPDRFAPENKEVQTVIRTAIEEAWRIEAKKDLPARVDLLCQQLGFRCGRVTIRNARTRWGSCSARDDISLSIHLMKLPDHLIDYVVIHELCHTRHKNHGPHFHTLLHRMTGGRHESLRRELKSYHTYW